MAMRAVAGKGSNGWRHTCVRTWSLALLFIVARSSGVWGQPLVQLGMVEHPSHELEFQLRPDGGYAGLISATVITVRWPTTSGVVLNSGAAYFVDPSSANSLGALASQGPIINGTWSYLTFTTFGLGELDPGSTWTANTEVPLFRVPYTNTSGACVQFELVNDAFEDAQNILWFISLEGLDRTNGFIPGKNAVTGYPEAVCQNLNAYLTNAGTATISAAQVNAGGNAGCGSFTATLSTSVFTCAQLGPQVVTLTLDRGNGILRSCTANVSVLDTVRPVVTTAPGALNVSLLCSNAAGLSNALLLTPTATDNCGAPARILLNDATTPALNCPNAYTRTRTWRFVDASGNPSLSFDQTITVTDNVPPIVLAGTLNNTYPTVAAAVTAALAATTVSDNCTATPALVRTTATVGGPCALGITVHVSDACGNAAQVSYLVDLDADGDGLADCNDNCPNVPGQIGAPCNDGNPNTINDALNGQCQCVGTPVQTCDGGSVRLVLSTDASASQTSWVIFGNSYNDVICSGSGYANNSTVIAPSCALNCGCYDLLVFDSAGDGIAPGGFVLYDGNGQRIIDNANNGFAFTDLSQAPSSFCVPIGTARLTDATCDQLNLSYTSVIQAQVDPAVSAQYATDPANSGYQWWFFNPNGGYSRKLFYSITAPGSDYPNGTPAAERCSYLALAATLITNPVPQFVLLNVRVRTKVHGVFGEWGPACRLKIDPLTNCLPSQLTTTADPIVSCGAVVPIRTGVIWATPVAGANKYQWEFTNAGQNYLRRIAFPSRKLTMSLWTTILPTCGPVYACRVRVSFDNGTTYCPYSTPCNVTFSCAPALGPGSNDVLGDAPQWRVWPNPSDGGELHIALDGRTVQDRPLEVDLFDVSGRCVMAHALQLSGGKASLPLDASLPSGVYLVRTRAAELSHEERLIIAR